MKERCVGSAPFLSALPEADQERISERMHLEIRRSGEDLFRRGDDSTALYLVKTGWVRLVAEGGVSIASQGPGSLVGETDLFLERPHTVSASTASDAEVLVLSRQDLADLVSQYPQIGVGLSAAFGARLGSLDRYLVERRLKGLAFLSSLKDDALLAIARHLAPIQKKAGEFLFERGEPPKALYIVESGQVYLHGSEEGGDFTTIGPAETFGEMALLTGKPYANSAQIASDAVLWALPAAEFESLASDQPGIRLALSRTIREPLSSDDKVRAEKRLDSMPLFAGLSPDVLDAVADRMLIRHIPAGELVFAEGEAGDALYLIDTGQVEIAVSARPGSEVLASLGPDEFFGEMALLTGKPRSSAARAQSHTNLWVLYRSDFEELVNRYPSVSVALSKVLSQRLAEMDGRFTESHLRRMNLLAGLSTAQLEGVGRRLKPARFRQGEVILREGAAGDEMHFIEAGRVSVVRGAGREATLVAELGAGDVIGEMSLLTGNPRSATVTALSDVDVWTLAKPDFDSLVIEYPNLALALSRLLSERLRSTEERFLGSKVAGSEATTVVAAQAAPPVTRRISGATRVAATVPAARAAPRAAPVPIARPARRERKRGLATTVSAAFGRTADWYGALSRGAKIRLILLTLLLIWLLGVAVPALLISTLAAADVTDLRGAVAWVHSEAQVTVVPVAKERAAPASVGAMATAVPAAASESANLMRSAALEVAVAAEASVEPTLPPPSPVPPTATPYIIVVTNTPVPVTDTPVPTSTPVPPTPRPKPKAAAASVPLPSPTSAAKAQAPRDLDPRLGALQVTIAEPAGLAPGQSYWRLVRALWEGPTESGNDHTIYIEVIDENGSRVVGQPILIEWPSGSQIIYTEDKPPQEYPANFPQWAVLGSYTVSLTSLPSDRIMGMGMGTPEERSRTYHTNFKLVFQRTTR